MGLKKRHDNGDDDDNELLGDCGWLGFLSSQSLTSPSLSYHTEVQN